jgi:hypothetical protein
MKIFIGVMERVLGSFFFIYERIEKMVFLFLGKNKNRLEEGGSAFKKTVFVIVKSTRVVQTKSEVATKACYLTVG